MGRELLERDIERQCGGWLQANGIFFFKVVQNGYYDGRIKRFRRHASPYFMRGVSDFICVLNGKVIFLELKTKRGQQSSDQKIFAERARKSGAQYFIIRDVAELKHAFDLMKVIGQH